MLVEFLPAAAASTKNRCITSHSEVLRFEPRPRQPPSTHLTLTRWNLGSGKFGKTLHWGSSSILRARLVKHADVDFNPPNVEDVKEPRQASDDVSTESASPLRMELDHVRKVFGDRVVVDDISIYVQQGEVVGLLGPNGAGKSTTFSIMVGRDAPTEGAVRLGDKDITALALERRARMGIGYMTQEPSVFRGLTVHDNILLVLEETGVPRAQRQSRLEELLELFRLHHVANTPGSALSGGERRRTELARALASTCSGGPPAILLVDEPFAGVDPIGVSEIQTLLRHLCKVSNMGILITDHNVTETLNICDRAYMVYKGRVMASGSPEELYDNKYVRQYYLGDGYFKPSLHQGD